MFSVWFCDLPKVISAMKKKVPNLSTFCKIEGNYFGDFLIEDEIDKWIVKHNDFSVWYFKKDDNKWVEL